MVKDKEVLQTETHLSTSTPLQQLQAEFNLH